MTPPEPALVLVDVADPAPLVARMDELASADRGWINLEPDLPEEIRAAGASGNLLRLFSARDRPVPLGTWLAAHDVRKGREPAQVGLRHGLGRKAAAHLAEAGVAVPEGWVVVQDHPKRGMVLAVPPWVANVDTAAWLVQAVVALTPWRGEAFGDRLRATVHV